MKWAPGHEPIKEGPRCARLGCSCWRRPLYDPYCGFHCQETARMSETLKWLDGIRNNPRMKP